LVDRDRESLIAGGAVLGISALLFTQVLPGQFEGVALARNPMTFPRFLLLLFAAGGAALFLRGLLTSGADTPDAPPVAWRRTLAVVVLAGLYFAAFAPIGFIATTLVFLPAMMLVLGYRNALMIVAVTLLCTVGLWYAFAEGFSIRPPGIGIDDMLRALRGSP
jgi:hypothetical protein